MHTLGHILLFFDVSGGELLIILLLVFLLFGPKKLPEISRKIGRLMFQFKQATNKIKSEIDNEGESDNINVNQGDNDGHGNAPPVNTETEAKEVKDN